MAMRKKSSGKVSDTWSINFSWASPDPTYIHHEKVNQFQFLRTFSHKTFDSLVFFYRIHICVFHSFNLFLFRRWMAVTKIYKYWYYILALWITCYTIVATKLNFFRILFLGRNNVSSWASVEDFMFVLVMYFKLWVYMCLCTAHKYVSHIDFGWFFGGCRLFSVCLVHKKCNIVCETSSYRSFFNVFLRRISISQSMVTAKFRYVLWEIENRIDREKRKIALPHQSAWTKILCVIVAVFVFFFFFVCSKKKIYIFLSFSITFALVSCFSLSLSRLCSWCFVWVSVSLWLCMKFSCFSFFSLHITAFVRFRFCVLIHMQDHCIQANNIFRIANG